MNRPTLTPRETEALLILAGRTGRRANRVREIGNGSVAFDLPGGARFYLTPDNRLYRSPIDDPVPHVR